MVQSAVGQKRASSSPQALFARIPPFWAISLLLVVLLLCIGASEQAAVNGAAQQGMEESPFESWFDRQNRAPKPKFIRFGRANGGQKFIRFGKRSPQPEYGAENLDELIDVVEDLYPAQLRQAAYLSAPKRAQKFIRFG